MTEGGMDRPKSEIEREIFDLTLDLHKRGHTRKEIVYYLREVADDYEEFWSDHYTYDLSPSEKGASLPGDRDE